MKDAQDQILDTLVDETGPNHAHDGPGAWLISIGSPENDFLDAGRVFPLDGIQTVRFGRGQGELTETTRDQTLELAVPLGWVSGQHAELRIQPTISSLDFEIEDLGSRNGTMVANGRITERRRIEPGEVFEIGRSFWMVRELGLRRMRQRGLDALNPAGTCNPRLYQLLRTLHGLAPTSLPIVLHGETGTGKSHLAGAIHVLSRRTGPLVASNLAVASSDQAEQRLFGSGTDRRGLFERADGGTLVLDELAELPSSIQPRLVAAIDQGRTQRLGEDDGRTCDERLVSRTLAHPRALVESGPWRPDLYSRLAGFAAEVPPLRTRLEDLGLLTRDILAPHTTDQPRPRLETAAFRRLMDHGWAFNVREYARTLRAASLLTTNQDSVSLVAIEAVLWTAGEEVSDPDTMHVLRHELVRQLAEHGGAPDKVACAMGRDPEEVKRWLERFAIEPELYQPH